MGWVLAAKLGIGRGSLITEECEQRRARSQLAVKKPCLMILSRLRASAWIDPVA